MAPPSRMQLARRRLKVARYSISAVAFSAFAAFGIAVRASHPATHTTATTAAAAASSSTESSAVTATENDDSSSTAVISPAPQTVAPQVQSSGS